MITFTSSQHHIIKNFQFNLFSSKLLLPNDEYLFSLVCLPLNSFVMNIIEFRKTIICINRKILTGRPSALIRLGIHIVGYFCWAGISASILHVIHVDHLRIDLKIQVDVKS